MLQGCFHDCASEGPAIKWRLFHLSVGALTQDTTFTVTEVNNPQEVPELPSRTGGIIDLSSSNTDFISPIRVTFPYDATRLQELGIDEADLVLYRFSLTQGRQWAPLTNQQVDTVNNIILAQLTSLSFFTVGESPAPPSVNRAPFTVDDTATTLEDTPLTIDVLLNDFDPDGDALTVTSVITDSNTNGQVSINEEKTAVIYTPDDDFNGTGQFSYIITDGSDDAQARVTVTVTPVNDPPEAVNDTYGILEGGTLTVDTLNGVLLSNDSDPNDGLSPNVLRAALVAGPTNGTLTLNPGGSFTYIPNDNFNGPDTFTYQISDDGGTDNDGNDSGTIATVTITVTPVNDEPSLTTLGNQGEAPELVLEEAGVQTVAGFARPHCRVGGRTKAGRPSRTPSAITTMACSAFSPPLTPTGN
jgi:hypothetical protein